MATLKIPVELSINHPDADTEVMLKLLSMGEDYFAMRRREAEKPAEPCACHCKEDAAKADAETQFQKKSCSSLSWVELAEIAKEGHAAEILTIGDCKPLTLTDGQEVVMQIVGFGQDTAADTGDPAGITWVSRGLLNKERPMNEKSTNAGGWEKSKLREWLNNDLFGSLPDFVSKNITPVLKVTYTADGERQITEDELFLLSEHEIFGRLHYGSKEAEGEWYDYFRQENVDYRKSDDDNEILWYWLRSPRSSASTAFCSVNSDGTANGYGASDSNGVAFGFCF